MDMTACSFTGHRPQRFSFGYDEDDPKCDSLKVKMIMKTCELIEKGVRTFYTGMAQGVDQWAAEIVLDMKQHYHDVRLIAVLPCETQAAKWTPEQRDRYYNIIDRSDEAIPLQDRYTSDCMHKRNRWLVEHAEYLLAVYDDSGKGGTAYTVRYAREKQRQIISIHPDTLKVSTNTDFEARERRDKIRVIRTGEE